MADKWFLVALSKFIKLEGERTQRHLGLCGLSPPSYSTRLIAVSAVENHPTFMGWFQKWVTNKLILESLELKLNPDYDMWKKVTQIEKKAESTAVHSDCWISVYMEERITLNLNASRENLETVTWFVLLSCYWI